MVRRKEPIGVRKVSNPIKKEDGSYEFGYRDFLIRNNEFRCMHNNHKLIDIVAVVSIDDHNHNRIKVNVDAGYCEQCNKYFIMESTYEKLKNRGVILCRICDDKSFSKSMINNDMKLSNQSLLMQYGYNVNSQKGLSEISRRKILSFLLDNDIMTKSEIISYLDFFINQRSSDYRFRKAIAKWKADRNFIEDYDRGDYRILEIKALSR